MASISLPPSYMGVVHPAPMVPIVPSPPTVPPSVPPSATASVTPFIPPSAPPMDLENYRMMCYKAVADKYDIRADFCAKLRKLEDYEIILVADDSGSMNTRVVEGTTVSAANALASASATGAFAPSRTRWTELLEFSNIVTDIASIMDRSGMDIYFLNRPPLLNVTSSSDPRLGMAFSRYPSGSTPLVKTLQNIIHNKCRANMERRFLIIIATDGVPDEGANELFNTIKYRPSNVNISILACTDDEAAVSYMNKIDRCVPGVDVVDDYRSERIEIQRHQGASYSFSYGDYVVKVLLGSIDPEMDRLDESGVGCCDVM
jgi:hypothetical protein